MIENRLTLVLSGQKYIASPEGLMIESPFEGLGNLKPGEIVETKIGMKDLIILRKSLDTFYDFISDSH